MASPALSPAGLRDIHGIINLDEISKLFMRMLQRLDQQDQTISQLQQSLTAYTQLNAFQDKIGKIEHTLGQIESKLQRVSNACTSKILDKEVTSGELASSNFFQLQKLSKALAACISRTEVEAQYQHFMKIGKSTLALQKDMANLSKVADELNQSHLLINQRLGTAESAITQKLDRSELMHVQALASKVSLYDDFRLKTLQCIEELYIAKADLEETVGEHSETLLKHANELQGLTALSTKLATKRDIHTLAREIEKHSAEIAVCVTMPTFNQLDQRVDDLSSSLHSCAELVQTHDQHIDRMQKALKTKATVQQVEKCVLKEDYVEFLAMNDENMASKAPLSVTDVLKLELQRLDALLSSESRRVDLAIRFVDWFTQRGESYEHNIQLIDKHLKDLAIGGPWAGRGVGVHTYVLPGQRVMFEKYAGGRRGEEEADKGKW
eukprot:gene24985-30183_t